MKHLHVMYKRCNNVYENFSIYDELLFKLAQIQLVTSVTTCA